MKSSLKFRVLRFKLYLFCNFSYYKYIMFPKINLISVYLLMPPFLFLYIILITLGNYYVSACHTATTVLLNIIFLSSHAYIFVTDIISFTITIPIPYYYYTLWFLCIHMILKEATYCYIYILLLSMNTNISRILYYYYYIYILCRYYIYNLYYYYTLYFYYICITSKEASYYCIYIL